MFAAGKSASSGIRATYIGNGSSAFNLTTFDFGNFVIPGTGIVVVIFTTRGGNPESLSSITVGGTTATLVAGAADLRNANFGYVVKSAGTHNVTANLTGNRGVGPSTAASVWLIEGYISATPIDSELLADANNTTRTITLDHSSGGVALYAQLLNSADPVNWSSATEMVDLSVDTRRHAHAIISPTGTASGHGEVTSGWATVANAAGGISFR